MELARRGYVALCIDEYGHGSTDIGMIERGYVNHKVTTTYGYDEDGTTYVQIGGVTRYKVMMNFSNLYYKGGQSFWCTKATASKFTDLASANNPDYTIGAQTGSIQADLAAENTPDANVLDLAKVTDIIADMLAGKMDGAFIETAVGESYAKNYPDLVKVCDVPYDQEGSSVGVNKDNAALLAAINLIVDEAVSDGTIDGFVANANELAAGAHFILDADGEIVADE